MKLFKTIFVNGILLVIIGTACTTAKQNPENPNVTSGLRIGLSAATARGMKKPEILQIVDLIDHALKGRGDQQILEQVSEDVLSLCRRFPYYKA